MTTIFEQSLWQDGLTGGALIGSAAAVLLLANGDILGASGIVSTVSLNPLKALHDPTQYWKLAFLASFLITTALYLAPSHSTAEPNGAIPLSSTAYALAGLLVGFGTKLGNGCTSGHGICGLARLSKRSLAAVLTFMFTAIMTTMSLHQYPISFLMDANHDSHARNPIIGLSLVAVIATAVAVAPLLFHDTKPVKTLEQQSTITLHSYRKVGPAALAGALFASGLSMSHMVDQDRVFGFLNLRTLLSPSTVETPHQPWDATLMMVMGGGVLVSFASYQFLETFRILRNTTPISYPLALGKGSSWQGLPTSQLIDAQLLAGATLFGMGWGLAGCCPGPALYQAASGNLAVLQYWWPAFLAGSYAAQTLKNQLQ